MTETRITLSHMWRSGGRSLLIGVVIFVGAFVVLFAVSLFAAIHALDKPTPNPLSSPSPEQIVDKKPFYHTGDVFVTLASKCNNSKEPVRITGRSYWENVELGGPEFTTGNNTAGGRDVPPGCMPLQFPHTIPANLAPGKWRLTGQDCLADGRCTEWFSDSFMVVP